MAGTFVLDTHALIWFLQGDSRLGLAARLAIEHPENELIIPAIALAEAIWIVERGRTSISSPTALPDTLDADARFRIAPLDRRVLNQSVALVAIAEMHDRQIVATTLVSGTPENPASLITTDAQITSSAMVPVIW